ncbi:MAG: TetR/AcrR family transcriptional regulator [Christensenellaceae bacterium]|jgi:AcrR family transcriptional regulator
MQNGKTDRRVKYTIMVLKDALVEALQQEHVSNISVKALCERADVNRSTFYAHFSDQHDLLHYIEQEVLGNIKEYLAKQDFHDKRPISFQVLNRILEYVEENANLFKALLSDNCGSGIQREILNVSELLPAELFEKTPERTRDYLAIFGITGCVSVLQKWLQDGMPEATTEISELIMQILYHGAASVG